MTKRVKYWVLQNHEGLYFRRWGGIGPGATTLLADAFRFESRRMATLSAAYSFSLETYEPVAIR